MLTWAGNTALTSGNWWGIMYADSLLWAWEEVWGSSLAGPVVQSSDDGATWTAPATIDTGFQAYGMAWNGSNVIVVVGNGIAGGLATRAYVRTAGVWAAMSMPSAALWHSVAWNGTTFCAVKNNGAATSVSGASWTARALTIGLLPIIIANGTTFLAVSNSDGICRRSITNGASFTNHTMPSSNWRGLAVGAGTVVAIGFDKIAYSLDDGQTWIELAIAGNWRAIAWDGTQFCAVPSFGSSQYAISADGIVWSTAALPDPAVGTYMTSSGANTFYYLWFNSMYKSAGIVPSGISPFFHFTFPVTG